MTQRDGATGKDQLLQGELLQCGLQRANTKATCVVMRNKDMSEKMNVTCDPQIPTLMYVY